MFRVEAAAIGDRLRLFGPTPSLLARRLTSTPPSPTSPPRSGDSPASPETPSLTFVPAIGQSDFRKLREAGLGYIDKTDFLRALLADPSRSSSSPGLAASEKTISLSALGYFLRKTGGPLPPVPGPRRHARSAAMAHFQRYPTLSVTFKDVKGTTFGWTIEIAKRIERQCREHRYACSTTMPLDSGRTHPG
ncbi:MAG: hypothetical protein R3B70_47770 [Polyangiaceae bacterium]